MNQNTYHVYLIDGKAIALPCKYEARSQRGQIAPKLRVRGQLLLCHVSKDRAEGYASGWNNKPSSL